MEREPASDAIPDSIAPPEEMADYIAWRETKWDYWKLKSQPENWLTKLLMAHAEDTRIQGELYDDRYRVDPKAERRQPINAMQLAELRDRFPKYAGVPVAALMKLYRKRSD